MPQHNPLLNHCPLAADHGRLEFHTKLRLRRLSSVVVYLNLVPLVKGEIYNETFLALHDTLGQRQVDVLPQVQARQTIREVSLEW